jgi:hypothetical protein
LISLPVIPHHWIWRDGPVDPGEAVVFDMDGVLSDASQRQHYLDGPFQQWEAFFAACGEDDLIPEAAELARLIDPQLTVILLTARPVRVRRQTLDWLHRHPVRWDLLVMRDDGDWASSHSFKQAEMGDLQARGFAVRLAVDDDPRNVEMYRRAGVPAVYFHSGYYE